MDIPVLIRPVPGKGYVATAPAFGWSAEGATADDALANLNVIATRDLGDVYHVTNLDVGVPTAGELDPMLQDWKRLMESAGELKNHPLLDDWRNAVAEYRAEIDNDLER
jgi:hypothetical protein